MKNEILQTSHVRLAAMVFTTTIGGLVGSRWASHGNVGAELTAGVGLLIGLGIWYIFERSRSVDTQSIQDSQSLGNLEDFAVVTTARGLKKATFSDRFGEKCSLQEASIDCALWLGKEEAQIVLYPDATSSAPTEVSAEQAGEALGGHKIGANCRMLLTQEHVRALLPVLAHFAETSSLPQ